jgi:hypothetical protein
MLADIGTGGDEMTRMVLDEIKKASLDEVGFGGFLSNQ